jgi:regulator of replication initiation timing
MESKLEQVAQRVDGLLRDLQQTRGENRQLRHENEQLRAELATIQKQARQLELRAADQSEAVRTRLQRLLGRLNELEQMAS